MHRLRRELVYVRRNVWPLRDAIAELSRSDSPLVADDTHVYLRDLHDHVVQVIDGRKTMRGHGTPDMPVWREIFPKTQGTASPSVETAVARITHYVWSIQQK